MKTQHKGFTLIELVVVIVILGILAATALPKFVDLGKDARLAKAKAVEGAVRTAAETWHVAMLAADPGCLNKNQDLTRNGVTVFTIYCYPQAGNWPLGGKEIQTLVDTTGYTVTWPDGYNTVFQVDGASDPTNCGFQYREPSAAGGSPTYIPLSAGC